VIPGNDDAIKAIRLYTEGVADAIIEGRAAAVIQAVEEIESRPAAKKPAARKPAAPVAEAVAEKPADVAEVSADAANDAE